ncbi:MAG TPA: hypothetical protein VFS29_01455 [Motilibacteraceae bacterium]|nr:hypothetical protein [Motilibacteraceae bacterium]
MGSGVWRSGVLAASALALAGLTACASGSSGIGAAAPGGARVRGGQAASCVGPQVTASPTSVRPGQELHVSGRWFHSGCDDVVANGVHLETQGALTGLQVRLEQGTSRWTLAGDVDATTADGLLDLRVTLPAALRPGAATLRVTGPGLPLAPSVALSVEGGS